MDKFNIAKRLLRLLQKHSDITKADGIEDVFQLFSRGACREAYAALCEMMKEQPDLCAHAFTCVLHADLSLYVKGDTCEAQKSLDRAQGKLGCSEPKIASYYYRVQGDVKSRLGNTSEAVDDYEKSVALSPDISNLTMLAQSLSVLRDARAPDVWVRVLEEDPQNSKAYVWLARQAARSGDRDKAISLAKKAEQLKPFAEDVFDVACLYHDIGQPEAALSAYFRADAMGYEGRDCLYAAIADCYRQLGKADKAKEYAQRALECGPGDGASRGRTLF